MGEYYLTELNEDNIPDISKLVDESELEPSTDVNNGFPGNFNPNHWKKPGFDMWVYMAECPLEIRTDGSGGLEKDLHLPLIKKVAEIVDCKVMVSGVNQPYDMSLLREG